MIERLEYGACCLSVDYGPDRDLAAALKAGEIRAPLPIKTTMWIDRGGVKVSAGYRAPTVPVPIEAQ